MTNHQKLVILGPRASGGFGQRAEIARLSSSGTAFDNGRQREWLFPQETPSTTLIQSRTPSKEETMQAQDIRKKKKQQGGFTLIEIIAVLVLLGVLAAVIVPKYNDIVTEAKTAALNQAIAEGQARVNQASAQYLLQESSLPTAYGDFAGAAGGAISVATDAGDYTLAYAATTVGGDAGVKITATDADGNSKTGYALFPQ
jgi:prepilin-type N-terminal cleavage/methylation domain-containing protein